MKRHRNHVLEDQSVAALESMLPEMWVVHHFYSDYGIDVQIEIFDVKGNSTGLRVYGQLKATDNSESNDVLNLDRNHFEYWSAHSDPVLLLRFFAPTKSFKWCWMHDIEWRLKPKASSVDASHRLEAWDQSETPKAIELLANLRREALFQRIAFPMSISITNATEGVRGSLRLAELIGEQLPDRSFKVLGGSDSPSHFDVVLEGAKLSVGHIGLPGYVVTCDSDLEIETIAGLTVLLLFLIACRYDRSLAARAIAHQAFPLLYRTASGQFELLLIDGLVYTLGIETAIASILNAEADKKNPVFWCNVLGGGLRASKRYGQTEMWIQQLKIWADSPPVPEMAGSTAYNLANALAYTGRWLEALKYYSLAAERDPDYLNRDYYWGELGAAEFETEQATAAAASYQRAYGINPTPDAGWRLGDALFHCGQYESAYNQLSNAISSDKDLGVYPQLVMMVCEELVFAWGIKEQEIKSIDVSTHESFMALGAATSADELTAKLQPYLELCAVDPQMSFNAGHLAVMSHQPRFAMFRFLTCALRQREDRDAWALAIAAACKAKESTALALIIESAYFYVGEELLSAVLKAFSQPPDLPKEAVLAFQQELIRLIRATGERCKAPTAMRIHGADGTRVFDIPI